MKLPSLFVMAYHVIMKAKQTTFLHPKTGGLVHKTVTPSGVHGFVPAEVPREVVQGLLALLRKEKELNSASDTAKSD